MPKYAESELAGLIFTLTLSFFVRLDQEIEAILPTARWTTATSRASR